MSCCTPQYIKIDIVSPTGSIVIQRETGNQPSCGYSVNYSGSAELNNYDYYQVDVNYDSGNGFWTFSGNSDSFQDPTVYRSRTSGNQCSPIGGYTGGIYEVIIQESNKWDNYQFEPVFESNTDNLGVIAFGSGIHKKRDARINFSFMDKKRNIISEDDQVLNNEYFDGIVYDILNKNKETVYRDYASGYSTSITITEKNNIDIFGSYTKDFGVRATVVDSIIGKTSIAEYYLYGNTLNINSVETRDQKGTTDYMSQGVASNTVESVNVGTQPTGFIDEIEERIAFSFNFDEKPNYVLPLGIYVNASKDENFSPSVDNYLGFFDVEKDLSKQEISIKGLELNKDYWFQAQAESELGLGNKIKFGPHRIFQKQSTNDDLNVPSFALYDINKTEQSIKKTFSIGSVYENTNNGSGIIDSLYIDTTKTGLGVSNSGTYIYEEENIIGSFLPINESGRWVNTTFEYDFEFKTSTDSYVNISKKIRMIATGTSTEPLNIGMPLFHLEDFTTGKDVNIHLNYNQSGVQLLCNTGHFYDEYKYYKTIL